MSQNLRSLQTGFRKLESQIENLSEIGKPDVILAQETFKVNGTYILDGYQPPAFKQRRNKNGGGVILWVKEGLEFKTIESPFLEENFESISIELPSVNEIIQLVNVYRPPQGSRRTFLKEIETLLQRKKNVYSMET